MEFLPSGDRVRVAITRIAEWFATNRRDLHEHFVEPASVDDLKDLEEFTAKIGQLRLPQDLKALWQVYDGADFFFLPVPEGDSASLNSVKSSMRAIEEYDCEDRIDISDDKRVYIPDGWAQKRWIPFGWLGNGGELFLDYCPASSGCLGQVVHNDSEGNFTTLAPSLAVYLEWVANSLDEGVIANEEDSNNFIMRDSSVQFWKPLLTMPKDPITLESVLVPMGGEEAGGSGGSTAAAAAEGAPKRSRTVPVFLTFRIGAAHGYKTQDIMLFDSTWLHGRVVPELSWSLDSTVGDLQRILHECLLTGVHDDNNTWAGVGLPPIRQRWLFGGKLLTDDAQTLASAGVVASSVVTVNIRPIV